MMLMLMVNGFSVGNPVKAAVFMGLRVNKGCVQTVVGAARFMCASCG